MVLLFVKRLTAIERRDVTGAVQVRIDAPYLQPDVVVFDKGSEEFEFLRRSIQLTESFGPYETFWASELREEGEEVPEYRFLATFLTDRDEEILRVKMRIEPDLGYVSVDFISRQWDTLFDDWYGGEIYLREHDGLSIPDGMLEPLRPFADVGIWHFDKGLHRPIGPDGRGIRRRFFPDSSEAEAD